MKPPPDPPPPPPPLAPLPPSYGLAWFTVACVMTVLAAALFVVWMAAGTP